MPGPAPKPTRLKMLTGNPGKRALNDNEPQPDAVTPECPPFLSGEARKEWKRITPELEALGLMTGIDLAGLAAYCVAYGRWVDAERELKRNGLTQVSPNGYVQQSPFLAISNKALDNVYRLIQQYGLTPASRSRVSTNPKPDDDEERFFT